MVRPELSPRRLIQLLRCDAPAGVLIWKPRGPGEFRNERCGKTWNTRFANKEALTAVNNYGYRFGTIQGRPYLAHRVLWAMTHGEWPDGDIDHINGDRLDNRLANLRCVSRVENHHNRRLLKGSKSGAPGVQWHRHTGKWIARIKVNYRSHYLGVFDELDAAKAARKAAEAEFGFHPNHGKELPHGQ